MNAFLDEYWKHAALNLGHVARDVRYFYYHPKADKIAKEGTLKHYVHSFARRVPSFANNLFFTVTPPHLHHTKEELAPMCAASFKDWFLHGYAPWTYPDPLRK